MRSNLLAIYLNDHLAGATAGVELARRVRSSNEADPELGEPLRQLCAEIEADRVILERVMAAFEVKRNPVKPIGAWLGEKLGRLKPNGSLWGYSPLSRMLELELLVIGITGKMRMWRVLEQAYGETVPGVDFDQLALRAASQRQRVEELHLLAAARALP